MAKQTSVYLDDDVGNSVGEIAKEEDRTFSKMMNILLKEALKRRET